MTSVDDHRERLYQLAEDARSDGMSEEDIVSTVRNATHSVDADAAFKREEFAVYPFEAEAAKATPGELTWIELARELTKALLVAEENGGTGTALSACGVCHNLIGGEDEHDDDCVVEQGLLEAGLPTKASRDEARAASRDAERARIAGEPKEA